MNAVDVVFHLFLSWFFLKYFSTFKTNIIHDINNENNNNSGVKIVKQPHQHYH